MKQGTPRRAALTTLIAVTGWMLAVSCSDSDTSPVVSGPLTICAVGGDGQLGTPGSSLGDSLAVAVADDGGARVPGLRVDFSILYGDATVEPESAVTDSQGHAATAVTIGDYVTAIAVEATVYGYEATVEFAATAAAEIRVAELPGGSTMEFVWVEPDTFYMGADSSELGWSDDEGPLHEVTITEGYWLGKFEITQGQWMSEMGSHPWSGHDYVGEDRSRPAVYISWNDVHQFLDRLNAAAGEDLYRLPTEAEWEYACRSESTSAWFFGDYDDALDEYGWYAANAWDAGLPYALPVGSKSPNWWGFHDLNGNVCEWVEDWYGPYTDASQTDPTGPGTGSARVIRGGDFSH